MSVLRTACPLDCPDGCTLEVEVEEGRLVRVDAPGAIRADGHTDPTVNPFTQGFICKKVKGHPARVYSPARVMTPLVRTGPKGSAQFRPASWDEALDVVAARIRVALDDDPATVVPYLYNSSAGEFAAGPLSRLLWGELGASAVHHTICAATASRAWELTFGSMLGADLLDVVHARLVVVWGANPAISNTHLPPLVNQARRAGATLVVVDPRRTAMARRADLHVAPRPGTDVVLAMAVAGELARRGLVDHSFTEAHVSGVDEYLAACRAWTVERAVEICDVPEARIHELVELVGSRRPAFWRPGWGLERNRNGGSAVRAVLALPVLAGSFGEPGAGVHLHTDHDLAWDSMALRRAVFGADGERSRHRADPAPARRGVNQNRLGALLTEPGDEPPVNVLFVQGANPAVMNPAQAKVLAGLAREDLFTVVHDQVLTDTARFADVVLPATTHFEVDDVAVPYGAYVAQAMPAVIERVGESRTNDEVAAGIAARLGFDASPGGPFDPSLDRLRSLLLPAGVPHHVVVREPGCSVQFRDLWPTTADRRAHLVADPTTGEAGDAATDGGAARVPRYAELPSPHASAPLALLTPATAATINSIFGEADSAPSARAAVHLHPSDAADRGLVDGQAVRVSDGRSELHTVVVVDADLRRGVATLPKGLWRGAFADGRGQGYTANVFAPDALSDLAGGATFNDARVEVSAL
ncbi:MAG TPA: molybdopterin-dependent oxidoreductase [Acidimicrobiales bacterium]|nr:molybdopterin-dependent oxidoreductase [Acidimicrobiales bacterium]